MEKVRIGVVGLGGMGQGHIKKIGELEEAELTAVSDVDEDVTGQIAEEHGVPGFTEYTELMTKDLVDAVLVATPHYFHPEVSVSAMERGIHCLSEKPLAVTVSDADKMIEAARKNNVVFSVMFQMRAAPEIRAARKLVEDGKIGEVRRTCAIVPELRTNAYYASGGWRATWKGEGGGVLINQAPHAIDIFLLLGGLPSRVTAKTRTRLHAIEVDDEAAAMLSYHHGGWGYFYASTNEASYGWFLEISGDRGKIVYVDGQLKYYALSDNVTEFVKSSDDMWGQVKTSREKVALADCESGHKELIRNFCRSIMHGEELVSPGDEGLKAVEFINALILSGKKNAPVNIPVDRAEYEALLKKLRETSKRKVTAKTKRVTDPRH